MKPLRFVGTSLAALRAFPAEARRHAGFELDAIQRGFMPGDFKPLVTVGPGVYEIRIRVAGEWRIIFIARRAEAIYVLHAFKRKPEHCLTPTSNWRSAATGLYRTRNEHSDH